MTAEPLIWELRFRDWLEANEARWERLEFSYGSTGDRTTAYRLSPAGRPARRVVAVHGAGNDALFGWVGLFKRLLLAGAEIFTFDLPGHGRLNQGRYSPESARASVSAAISEGGRDRDDVPLHAIGVSLGGSVLLASLPESPTPLASATVIVAPLHIELSPRSFIGELRLANFATLFRERVHYGSTGLVPSFGPFKREIYPLRLQATPPPGAFGYVETLNQTLDELQIEAAAERIRTPTVLVYGDRDRIVPLEQGRALARRIPGSVLEVIRGGSHLSTPLHANTVDLVMRWIEAAE